MCIRDRPSTAPPTPTTSIDGTPRARRSNRRPPVPATVSFDYAAIRMVPRVEREEFVNAGVILFCSERDWLDARVQLATDRLRMLHREADLASIEQHLAAIPRICAGDP